MSQPVQSGSLLGDPVVKVGVGMAILFILGLIVIEMSRDEDTRAGVGATASAVLTTIAE